MGPVAVAGAGVQALLARARANGAASGDECDAGSALSSDTSLFVANDSS